jgi:hypothetical protein
LRGRRRLKVKIEKIPAAQPRDFAAAVFVSFLAHRVSAVMPGLDPGIHDEAPKVNSYVRESGCADAHTNSAEGYFGIFKKGMKGVHRGVQILSGERELTFRLPLPLRVADHFGR